MASDLAQRPLTRRASLALGALVGLWPDTMRSSAPSASGPWMLRGVNVSGAELGNDAKTFRGALGTNYIYPTGPELRWLRARGHQMIRLPVRWERLQPDLGGPFDPAKLSELRQCLALAGKARLRVLFDLHNFGEYFLADGTRVQLGRGVTLDQFRDVWVRLVRALRAEPAVVGWGLMNEPHDLAQGSGGGDSAWVQFSRAAVSAIRAAGDTRPVFVAGDEYSGAQGWTKKNPSRGWVEGDRDTVIYEAHYYPDGDHSGVFADSFDAVEERVRTEGGGTILERSMADLAEFVAWLRESDVRGYIGEIGWPFSGGDSERWAGVGRAMYDYLQRERIGSTYWSTGAWWGDYRLNPYRGTYGKADSAGSRPPGPVAVIEKALDSEG